jgi:two-component system, NarL family, sensor histidine kinase BarA
MDLKGMLNVLVIDDNKVFVNSFIKLLNDALGDRIGSIDYCFSGKDGLQMLNEKMYDYVFLDIDLPDVMGQEIASRYNKIHFRRNTKIIAISYHKEFEFMYKMIQAGVNEYMVKEEIDYSAIVGLFNRVH